MVAELLPSFAPTPSSVAELASRLPVGEQARLQWFPDAFRAGFSDPLVDASRGELHARVDERMVDAVRIVLQLAASIGVLRERIELDAMTRGLEREEPRHACHDLIRQHLEPSDPVASVATAYRYPTSSGHRAPGPTDDELRKSQQELAEHLALARRELLG